jgi:hypothetical protein
VSAGARHRQDRHPQGSHRQAWQARLDPQEWQIIKTHTLEGQKMLNRVGGFSAKSG